MAAKLPSWHLRCRPNEKKNGRPHCERPSFRSKPARRATSSCAGLAGFARAFADASYGLCARPCARSCGPCARPCGRPYARPCAPCARSLTAPCARPCATALRALCAHPYACLYARPCAPCASPCVRPCAPCARPYVRPCASCGRRRPSSRRPRRRLFVGAPYDAASDLLPAAAAPFFMESESIHSSSSPGTISVSWTALVGAFERIIEDFVK